MTGLLSHALKLLSMMKMAALSNTKSMGGFQHAREGKNKKSF